MANGKCWVDNIIPYIFVGVFVFAFTLIISSEIFDHDMNSKLQAFSDEAVVKGYGQYVVKREVDKKPKAVFEWLPVETVVNNYWLNLEKENGR